MVPRLNTEQKQILQGFREAVNMLPRDLETWLATDESKEVGWKGADGEETESVGHDAGERLLTLLRKRKAELAEEDFQFMTRVVGYIHRHLAQRPEGDISQTRWAYSLKNWGHDATKSTPAPVPAEEGTTVSAL